MKSNVIYFLIAFIFTAILGRVILPILKRMKVSQNERLDGPRTHLRKQGTPTMGGIIIIISMFIIGVFFCYVNNSYEIFPLLLASLGFGLVGFIDDFKKLILKNTEGLNPKFKMLGLLIISVIYILYLINYKNIETQIYIPYTNLKVFMPVWFYIIFSIIVMLGTTNAVNLTDGVDGLCGIVLGIITSSLSIICFRLGYIETATFSSIVSGSCFGFLIYNVYKAKIFMGDTGSLFLGGVISSIAIYLNNPLILIIIAIIPVVETLSVIFQVLYFWKTGKRLFRMAPLHHHFELSGWRENKVVVVFGLITLIFCIIGIYSV
ncbi:MAG: phospho-N-acetylmuramoyl-pentapeptide-transferase [Clostridia bacterium]|nr:phospho-N-acetylmuramoyl-pentapeptide-transferase [Clostridia bacterium]